MYCRKCGSFIPDDARFCVGCGQPVEENSETMNYGFAAENPVYNEVEYPAEGAGKRKHRTILIVSAVVGILALICVVTAGLLFVNNQSMNGKYKKAAESIDAYEIDSCAKEAAAIAEEWDDCSFINLAQKRKLLDELYDIEADAKDMDEQIKEAEDTLTALVKEKEQYDLAKSYDTYEKILEECSQALKNRDAEEISGLLEEAKSCLNEVITDNEDYIQDKLDEYKSVNLSIADINDVNSFNEYLAKVSELKEQHTYSSLKTVFEELDDIAYQYIVPEKKLDILVQQIDASEYPNIKLYLQMEDISTGQVPDKLSQNFFFVRKQNANGEYIKQEVQKVSQLNELEALNVDMVADVSGSMNGAPLNEAKNIMKNFVNSVQFNVGDKVELTSFSTGVHLEQEFTDNASVLLNKINQLKTDNMTSLYDGLYAATTRVAARTGARCVIAFTDGLDNYSNCSANDVVNTAKRYHVPIFIIGIGIGNAEMSSVAEQTGGKYYNVSTIRSMQDIYTEIYRQEKEMYMLEFVDDTNDMVTDEANVMVGYNSAEIGGTCAYAYTPNVLINVNGNALYGNGPESVVENYMRAFDDAMTNSDFSLISGYLKKDSNIYNMQQEYVKKDISEMLDSYEIVNVEYSDGNNCIITTRETYYVQMGEEPLKLLTQECKYNVECDNGTWYMTDFADSVQVISNIKQ